MLNIYFLFPDEVFSEPLHCIATGGCWELKKLVTSEDNRQPGSKNTIKTVFSRMNVDMRIVKTKIVWSSETQGLNDIYGSKLVWNHA